MTPTPTSPVIKIDADNLPAVSFGNSDAARIGDWVLAFGNPLSFNFTVTSGIVSAKGRQLQGLQDPSVQYSIQDFIQTDAAINPGNSGGPLVNMAGEVIGINAAIASSTGLYAGYGFAIPINLAHRVMDDLIAKGHVDRAILGISINDARPEDAEYVGLREIKGVLVGSYSGDDSPARAAGIQPGDIIVAVNDTAVDHVAQLQQMVGFRRPESTCASASCAARTDTPACAAPSNVRLIAADNGTTRAAMGHDSTGPGETEGRLGLRVEVLPAAIISQPGSPMPSRASTSPTSRRGDPRSSASPRPMRAAPTSSSRSTTSACARPTTSSGPCAPRRRAASCSCGS